MRPLFTKLRIAAPLAFVTIGVATPVLATPVIQLTWQSTPGLSGFARGIEGLILTQECSDCPVEPDPDLPIEPEVPPTEPEVPPTEPEVPPTEPEVPPTEPTPAPPEPTPPPPEPEPEPTPPEPEPTPPEPEPTPPEPEPEPEPTPPEPTPPEPEPTPPSEPPTGQPPSRESPAPDKERPDRTSDVRPDPLPTEGVVERIEEINDFCKWLPDMYQIDCLADRYAAIARQLGGIPENREVRKALQKAAKELRKIANDARDPTLPRQRFEVRFKDSRSTSRRPLTPIEPARLTSSRRAAVAVVDELSTVLLRASESSARRKTHYAKIAQAVDSNKVLLRS